MLKTAIFFYNYYFLLAFLNPGFVFSEAKSVFWIELIKGIANKEKTLLLLCVSTPGKQS